MREDLRKIKIWKGKATTWVADLFPTKEMVISLVYSTKFKVKNDIF